MTKLSRFRTEQTLSDTIGRTRELAYRITRGGQHVRRDVEACALNNQASVAGTDSVAGVTGGLPSWIETTVINADGSAATPGGHNDHRPDSEGDCR